MNLSPLEYQAAKDIQEKLNGNKILFGSYYNLDFEEVFLLPNKKIDAKKENYITWVLGCMNNPLEEYLIESQPYHFKIDAKKALTHANAVNLTMLILKKKIALYRDNQVISYEII
jgi:hypothetical protein